MFAKALFLQSTAKNNGHTRKRSAMIQLINNHVDTMSVAFKHKVSGVIILAIFFGHTFLSKAFES